MEFLKRILTPWWILFIGVGTVLLNDLITTLAGKQTILIPVTHIIIALALLLTVHGFRAALRLTQQESKSVINSYQELYKIMADNLSILSTLCIVDRENKLLISPGDLVDRLTILKIKKDKIRKGQEEFDRLFLLIKSLISHFKVFNREYRVLYEKLLNINLKQWDLEDQVRTKKSWAAAYAARMNNNKRVQVKNEINKLFNFPKEEKEYKTNEDSNK